MKALEKFFLTFLLSVGKLLDKTAKVNFKIYDFTNWSTNNFKKHIARFFKSEGNHTMTIIHGVFGANSSFDVK